MATLSVPASLEQLANVNAFIHETIPSSYRPLIPQVELAAEELLVNVFSYAYPDVPGEAQVACREVRLDNVPYFCFFHVFLPIYSDSICKNNGLFPY